VYYPVKIVKIEGDLWVCFPDLKGLPDNPKVFNLHNPAIKITDVNNLVQEVSLAFEAYTQEAIDRGFESFPKPSVELDGEMLMPISALAVRNIEKINLRQLRM
jgi:hypothetical protein